MNKAITPITFLALQLLYFIGNAQLKEFPQSQNHFLFTFQKDSYLILDDSVFCISGEKKGFPQMVNFVMDAFQFVENDTIGYLKNASNGIVYSFDGLNFTRLDNSFPFQTQHNNFSFLHEDQLLTFGGYGILSFKNILTYFNFEKKETDLHKVKSPLSQMPLPRDRMIAQYFNGFLYIGAGRAYLEQIEYPFNHAEELNDFWKFSFSSNEWKKLGESSISISYPYTAFHHYNGNTLVVSHDKILEYDIKNNLMIEYKDANLDFLNSFYLESSQDLTYNKELDGFFMALKKNKSEASLTFVKREDFLGTERVISRIYKPEKESNALILGGTAMIFLLIGLSMLIYKRKKKTLASTILSMTHELEKELKSEDFKVLIKIASTDPDYINYTDLMDAFPDHLGYESKKKKLRLSLIFLEDYLEHKFKLKRPVFIIRKNIEDKREKQVKFN